MQSPWPLLTTAGDEAHQRVWREQADSFYRADLLTGRHCRSFFIFGAKSPVVAGVNRNAGVPSPPWAKAAGLPNNAGFTRLRAGYSWPLPGRWVDENDGAHVDLCVGGKDDREVA